MAEEVHHVVNESALEWDQITNGKSTTFRRKRLGAAAGGELLGCTLYELPPGSKAWPYHYHTANEEAIYVLEGRGTLRTPDGTVEIRSGDYVALPVGEEHARRVVNDSDGTVRYLCVSTMREPDITVYPDSEKVGIFAGAAPGKFEGQTLQAYLPLNAEVDYWNGEMDDR